MDIRLLQPEEEKQAYKNMVAVAAMLTALSTNNRTYILSDVYFDFGARIMWTTISRRATQKDLWGDVQILSPKNWERIVTAKTAQDLADVVEVIRNDKYFKED